MIVIVQYKYAPNVQNGTVYSGGYFRYWICENVGLLAHEINIICIRIGLVVLIVMQ